MNQPQLRDIHLPDASLWWPPAPGWWIVALLVFALVLLFPWLRRRWRHQPLKRMALRELEAIRRAREAGQGDPAALAAIARLLRRVTISYFGRKSQAALTGAQWQAQLQRLGGASGFSEQQLELLTRGRYRADADADIEALLRASETWLRALPRGEDRVSA